MLSRVDGKYHIGADESITCGDLTPKVLMDFALVNYLEIFTPQAANGIMDHVQTCSMCRMSYKDAMNREKLRRNNEYKYQSDDAISKSIQIKSSNIVNFIAQQKEDFLRRSARDPIRHELREFPPHALIIDGKEVCRLQPLIIVPLGTPTELPFSYLSMAFPYTEIIIPSIKTSS